VNFDWEQLLELANELWQQAQEAKGQKREALLRSAASRAYYAAFNVAAEWLREHHPSHPLPANADAHQAVADFFVFHQEAEHRFIGERLGYMRQGRNQVDYRPRVSDSLKIARRNLFDANRVLNALAGLDS